MARSQYSQRSTFLKAGFTLFIIVVFVSLSFSGIGWSAEPSGASSKASGAASRPYGGVLRIVDTPPGSPFGVPWEVIGVSICFAIPALEPMVWMDRQGNLSPSLAESWKVA